MTWWSEAASRIAEGQAVALVTVCTVKGSAPREAGARMLVSKEDQHGSIGGGQLEFTIAEQARKLLAAGEAGSPVSWRFQNYPLGPLLGQCCGGHVGILIERLDRGSLAFLEAVARMEESGACYAIVSKLQADGVRRQVMAGGGGDAAVTARFAPAETMTRAIGEGAVITEQVRPRPLLLMFGAGHVGQALAPIVATLPFRLCWRDTRPEFVQGGAVLTADPVGDIAAAQPGSFFLIFTQSHALDYDLTRAVLARGDFAYCGLIGSATKRARFEKRLVADGIAPSLLARLTCPIGAIGLASKQPPVMAVGIAAELLLVLERAACEGAIPRRALHAT